MTIKRKPVRLLTNLKISEVSAVDRGAGEGCHVMLTKRDRTVLKAKFDKATARLAVSVKSIVNDPDCNDKRGMLARSFGQFLAHVNPRASIRDVAKFHEIFSKNLDVPVDPDGPINPGGDDSDGTRVERGFGDEDDEAAQVDEEMDTDENGGVGSHRAGDEGNAGGKSTDQLERAKSAMEEGTTTMKLMDIAKRHGWRAVCKHFVDNGTSGVSEAEVTALLTAVAKKSHPDLRPDVAFAKAYSAQTPDGELMRRTTMAARDAGFLSKVGGSTPPFLTGDDDGPRGASGRASLAPRVTSGRAAQKVDDPRSALDQLRALADEQRKQNTELTEAGAFARVYEDPKNAKLAARERAENRPTANW